MDNTQAQERKHRKLHNHELHMRILQLIFSAILITKDDMGGTCATHNPHFCCDIYGKSQTLANEI
jgi:hypothetical protein